jgi:hypothetical protein
MPRPTRLFVPEVEVLSPALGLDTDTSWREVADEVWTTMKNTERLLFTQIFERSFQQQISQHAVHQHIAQGWLERLKNTHEDLAIVLLRYPDTNLALLERLTETSKTWLAAAQALRSNERLLSVLVDTAARILLSSTLPQLFGTDPKMPDPTQRQTCFARLQQRLSSSAVLSELLLYAIRPLEREFFRSENERLLSQVWSWVNTAKQGSTPQGVIESPSPKHLTSIVEAARFIPTYSGQAMQSVDRAVRRNDHWEMSDFDAPTFYDDNNKHIVRYQDEGISLEQLQKEVRSLAPRTADVLRLITARSLDAWQENAAEPPSVWVDARELCELMGYQKAKKGGFRQEHIANVARALIDLERLWIEIPKGTNQYPVDPKSKKRVRTTLEANRSYRVFSVTGKDEVRDLFGNRFPLRWKVRPGDWIQSYPRQFAPLLAKIVELPTTGSINTWAKVIGTELTYQYRQDRNRSVDKTLTVERLLMRAGVLAEVMDWSKNRNATRARQYLEKALDQLQSLGVCQGWEYNPEDFDALEVAGKRWFELWLSSRILITAPRWLIDQLPTLEKPKAASKPKKRSTKSDAA